MPWIRPWLPPARPMPADHVESNSVTVNLTLISNSDLIGVASHRAALRFSQMNVLRILPIRLSGFGAVAMYWRRETFQPAAVGNGAGLSAQRGGRASGIGKKESLCP